MRRPTIEEEVADFMANHLRWLTPQEIVERKRKLAEERKAKARAAKRWGPLPTVVLVQDAQRAEAVLLARLQHEPEFVDQVWQANFAYHARLSALRGRHA
jgi:hypothetical protein